MSHHQTYGPGGATSADFPRLEIRLGHSLDLIEQLEQTPDLIVTDPPYAFGGSGTEHAISATVATVLRESAKRLAKGRWMLVMCASSYRSTAYMVESVRGIVEPVRFAHWLKPAARTKVDTEGWKWASVNVIAFRKGRALDIGKSNLLDHITAPPIINGRRAELPPEVARWMVEPYAVPAGLMFDPFAGSGALLRAANEVGMRSLGFEIDGACKECGGTGIVSHCFADGVRQVACECHNQDCSRG